MRLSIRIDIVIYFYLLACFIFMLFNYVYIIHAKRKKSDKKHKMKQWMNEIQDQFNWISELGALQPQHVRRLLRKLAKPETLIDYSNALDILKRKYPEAVTGYIGAGYDLYQKLAKKYKTKDRMERTYYASFISRFLPGASIQNDKNTLLLDTLTSYLGDSDVYCRENTLRALYALGNLQAVENALQMINDRGWFHHCELISDGLASFTGDKEALAAVLWDKYKKWDDYLMLAVVQFIMTFSPNYRKAFLPVLQDSSANLEIRLAIIRYYKRYIYKPVQHILIQYLNDDGIIDENLMIAAAFVLGSYPGNSTVEALIHSLSSSNWHIRNNAASALIAMETPETVLRGILQGDDKYASDMLLYKMEQDVYTYTDSNIEKLA